MIANMERIRYTPNELNDIVQALATTLEDLGIAQMTVRGTPDLPLKRTIDLLGARGLKTSVEVNEGLMYFKVVSR